MRRTIGKILLAPLAYVAFVHVAEAVCIDPKSGISGYQVPFEDELKSSIAIVLAEVVAERKVYEPSEDPEYYYMSFTVRTDQVLFGNPLKTFKLREELDSGRYSMSVGEKHLLFITKWRWKVRGADYVINSCGNSSRLPEGNSIVVKVQNALRRGAHAP
jgi:hypothetical protein